MKQLLIENGWVHFKTGCSCNGSPRYYKHHRHTQYIVILKNTFFTIKKDDVVLVKDNPKNLKQALEKHELI